MRTLLAKKLFSSKFTPATKLFIDGKFTHGVRNKTIPVYNPATEELICEISEATEEDVDLAVQAAEKGFIEWSKVSGDQKTNYFLKLADKLEANLNEFATLESIDNGKPLGDSLEDFLECIRQIRYSAGLVDCLHGKTYPTFDNRTVHTRRVPYGVVGCISPWNYPMMMGIWKIIPALVAGNSVVLKHSEETPLTLLKLGEIFQEINFPKGVINMIPGYGHSAGNRLTRHHSVQKISFTGSTSTGREIMKASADSNLKNVHLELGGKTPIVIFDDADLDNAVEWAIDGAFRNTGQNCTCGSRIFVQEGVYDKFLHKFLERTKQTKTGKYDEKGIFFGPLINQKQFDKCLDYIKHGVEVEKLNLLTGGKRQGNKGYFIEATVFENVPDSSKLAKEEIFGPVVCVMKPFKTVEEAITRANNTPYGLASSVFSSDMNKIEMFTRQSNAGSIWVNLFNVNPYYAPFGGMKMSGFGRDNGLEGVLEFTTLKTVYNKFNI